MIEHLLAMGAGRIRMAGHRRRRISGPAILSRQLDDRIGRTRAVGSELAGSHVVFGPRSVDGPEGIACRRAQYRMDGFTAPQLFQGKFASVVVPAGASPDEASPDGDYYDPVKLAERYGFKGFSWKALATGCKADTYFYFPDRKTAVFRIEDILLALKHD